MQRKIRTLWFAAGLFMVAAISTPAQGRFEVTPFVGYENTGSYPVSNNTGLVDRLRVNDSVAFGTFLDYNLSENFQTEFMWNRNNTSYSAHDISTDTYFSAYHSVIDQYQFGGLYMLRDSSHRLRPYFAASVGFTHDENGGGNPNRTEFSYSLGGGIKYYATKRLGFRADLRYLPTYGSSGVSCDSFYGCYQDRHYLNRGSFTTGVVFHF
jgi:hypothetical protein